MSSIGHAPAALTPDQRELLALEDAVLMAIRRRDPAALGALVTEDFVLLGADGSETRREAFLRAATDIPGELLELSALHLRVRVVGGVGVLSGLQRARVRFPTGVEVEELSFFTDVCIRTESGWRMALAHSGQAVSPAAPG
jgi:ketosteroid isomerase-like protein